MRIAIGGSHQMACEALSYLVGIGIDKRNILVCKSNRDYDYNTWQRSFIFLAKKLAINIVSIDELYDEEDLLFFSLEFDQIIKTKKFKSAKFFNIHFSLLPKYKGMFTSCLPLINGENESGVTLHRIDDGIDTGEIIDQIAFHIPISMNSFDLFNTYHRLGIELFKCNIQNIINRKEVSLPQSPIGSSYFSKKHIDFSKIDIDFRSTAFQIHNYIRAFSFRPYQLPSIMDFRISHSKITSKRSVGKLGTFKEIDSDLRIYSTIDFEIELYRDLLDAILTASAINDVSFLQKCYERGYNFSDKNDKGWDAGIVAAFNDAYEVLDFLLDHGMDPNSINNNGTSLLMYAMTSASKTGNLKAMRRLIKSGAKVDHQDFNGITLFEYSHKQGNPIVIEFLQMFK